MTCSFFPLYSWSNDLAYVFDCVSILNLCTWSHSSPLTKMNALSSYHRHLMQQMGCFREQMWTGSLHHKLIFSPFDQSKPSQWKESEAGSRLLTCSDFVIGFDGDGLCTIFGFHVDCCNILLLNGKRYAFFAHPGQVVTQFSSFASGLFAMRPFFVDCRDFFWQSTAFKSSHVELPEAHPKLGCDVPANEANVCLLHLLKKWGCILNCRFLCAKWLTSPAS